MSVACYSCASFSFKRVKEEWSRMGFGHCAHREPFIVHSATKDRDCDQHDPDAAEVVTARSEWIRRRGL